jgi:hypothetical protein
MALSDEIKKSGPIALVVTEVTEDDHEKVVELLRGKTMEVSYTVHGLPKSRKIGGAMAEQIASSLGGKRKGVRASWQMFASEHPCVKELNVEIRKLNQLRDDWTIVRSAEAQKGENGATAIAGGTRLLWAEDVTEFYAKFAAQAARIDIVVSRLQYAMDNGTEVEGKEIKSIKELDRANAGAAWDESVYPKDLCLVVGVAKERTPDGQPVFDDDGNARYLIDFREYHVSEKLPKLLRERAIKRIDEGLSKTIETAMAYATNELTEGMLTFLSELTNRTKIYPDATGEYGYLRDAEIIKALTDAKDSKVPPGHVKFLVRYKEKIDDENEQAVSRWFGPMPEAEFRSQFRPQSTKEQKKIFPSVIEGIIQQLEAFKQKKARMLGSYGTGVVDAFDPLLKLLTKAREKNSWVTDRIASEHLKDAINADKAVRQLVTEAVQDTVTALEEQVTTARAIHGRRGIKASLIGKVGLNAQA